MTSSGGRRLFVLCGSLAIALAACSGGGGGGHTPSGPTPTPKPTTTPTAPPSITVLSRPLNNGDTFAYAGTTKQTFVYNGASPSPSPAASSIATVTQAIAVSAPASYNGTSGLYDFTTTETDTTPLQTTTSTTQTYYTTQTSSTGTNLVDYGYTSTDSFGDSLTVAYGATGAPAPILIDELPEVPGASWTNTPAESLLDDSPGNQTSQRTVAANGSYTDTTTFPSGSLFSPVPSPSPVVATIVANADGSGTYSIPLFGTTPNTVITIGTPSPAGGSGIPITIVQPGFAPATGLVSDWYGPPPVELYTETDVNNGSQNFPVTCNVPLSYGTAGNALVQTVRSVDAILGTLETLTQTTYVIPTYGTACVVLNDQILSYYDYSGQNASVVHFSPTTPLETTTIATTLGLTSATVSSSSARSRAATAAAVGLRIANAKANFIATVERYKIAHERRLLTRLHQALAQRIK